LTQLTVDHSEAEEMVASGRITRDEARRYDRRNVVTRSLGVDPPEAVDSWVFPPVVGERFLLCSDGLSGEILDNEIEECLTSIRDPQDAAEELLKRAIAAGGTDNVTVVVVDGASEEPAGLSIGVDEDTQPREPRVV
jgi:serine/threonine protein phosphatase PrpC